MNIEKLDERRWKHRRVVSVLRNQYVESLEAGLYGTRQSHHIACLTDSRLRPVLTQSSKLIYGINARKSHPLMVDFKRHKKLDSFKDGYYVANMDLEQHAEMACMAKYLSHYRQNDLEGVIMWIVRFSRATNELMLSKPCMGCQTKLEQFQLSKVYHS